MMTEQFQWALVPLLGVSGSTQERIEAVARALESDAGPFLRQQLGEWIVTRLAPVERLVPEMHHQWRPLIRDAMKFVVARLSTARLAPKIVEQIELPLDTTPEIRLLRLIARVPGLQKIGQMIARNRTLHPELRRALSELENGISDVSFDEIRSIILEQLGARIRKYGVRLGPSILSEASVSAVVLFTWRNPQTRRRERGVFKVMKPHIPSCYAEDMKILQRLAGHLARKHRGRGIRMTGLSETLTEIRLLLEREVDFRREQATLAKALDAYRSIPRVRVPVLIKDLSTDSITALTHENGVKVTEATRRVSVAERLVEALVAVPALARERDALYHADPHAGNLLYDSRRGNLVILDWALTERLTSKHRRNLFMLVLMMILRDSDGLSRAIDSIRLRRADGDEAHARLVREHVETFLEGMPLIYMPGAMDCMRLLNDIALEGIRFPAALLMFRKASFTLEGVLADIAGPEARMDSVIARYAAVHWPETAATLLSLLKLRDWLALEYSLLTFIPRILFRPRRWPAQQRPAIAAPARA